MKILNSTWFTNKDACIGVVKVDVPYEGIKYFIGLGFGENKTADEQYIADWGSTFPNEAAERLFN